MKKIGFFFSTFSGVYPDKDNQLKDKELMDDIVDYEEDDITDDEEVD
jgi:hypothetical protein